jgi:hypothetical protein
MKPWHDVGVIVLARMVLRLVADLIGLLVLSARPRRSIEAENLVLRRQLALFRERGVRPRRVATASRHRDRAGDCSGATNHGEDGRLFRWSCDSSFDGWRARIYCGARSASPMGCW